MAFLQVLLLALIPYLIQAENRCGKDWTEANTQCLTKCPAGTNDQCPSGKSCFASCDPKPCGSPPPPPPPPPSNGKRTLTSKDLHCLMGKCGSTELDGWLPHVNNLLINYDLQSDKRICAIMSQIRHETASMTVFYQSIDNGGGFVHMTPSNWPECCKGAPQVKAAFAAYKWDGVNYCTDCSCTDWLKDHPSDVKTANAAKAIFGPNNKAAAAASAGWWFKFGASLAFNWKGCNQDLKYYADQGKGSIQTGNDCKYTGNSQLTCCIFWTTGGGSGIDQRFKYYDEAVAYAKSAWGSTAFAESEELTQEKMHSGVNIGIAIGCTVGLVAIVIVIVALYLKRKQRLQSEVV